MTVRPLKVLAVQGDAGGGRALLPVLHRIAADSRFVLECRPYGPTLDIWRTAGLAVHPFERPDLAGFDRLLCASGVGPVTWETSLMRAAAQAGIRSVSVLDFWSQYRERFTGSEGSLVLPDAIAIMDERARREMEACGFPAGILHVTGQPAFESLAEYDTAEHQARATGLGPALGVREGDVVVLYASQPLSQVYPRAELGYDEHQVLALVVRALAQALERRQRTATLLVRPHPRERDLPVPPSPSPRLAVRRLSHEPHVVDPRLLVLASDLVVGMSSTLLFEACWLRRPVVSVQPGLRMPEPLHSNELGWSRGVYDEASVEEALDLELFDDDARAHRRAILDGLRPARGAADRIVELLAADR